MERKIDFTYDSTKGAQKYQLATGYISETSILLQKVGQIFLIIVFFPVLVVVGIILLVFLVFKEKKEKAEYVQSEFFKSLNVPYYFKITSSPQYIFYENGRKKNIDIEYTMQENGLEYFVQDGRFYIFPEFDELRFDEEKLMWNVLRVEEDMPEEYIPLDVVYKECLERLENVPEDAQVKLLVQRELIAQATEIYELPEYVYQEDIVR